MTLQLPLKLDGITGDVPAKHWVQIRHAARASLRPLRFILFNRSALHSVHFGQSEADNTPHTLIIDEIKIDDRSVASPVAPEVRSVPPAPQNVRAKGYDRHIDISWDPVTDRGSAKLRDLPIRGRTQIRADRHSE